MQAYIKRFGYYGLFEKAKIEIDNVEDLAMIIVALTTALEKEKEFLEIFKEVQLEQITIDNVKRRIERLQSIIDTLENAKDWE